MENVKIQIKNGEGCPAPLDCCCLSSYGEDLMVSRISSLFFKMYFATVASARGNPNLFTKRVQHQHFLPWPDWPPICSWFACLFNYHYISPGWHIYFVSTKQTNHVWNGKISLSLKISLLFGDIFNSWIQLLCLCFSPESPFLKVFTHKFEFYIFLWAKPMQVQSPDPYCTLPDSALPLKSFTPNTCSPFALFRFTRFLKVKEKIEDDVVKRIFPFRLAAASCFYGWWLRSHSQRGDAPFLKYSKYSKALVNVSGLGL